jgi:hypothetical protein
MYTIPWSMPIHQSDAHTVLTYVDHTLSQVPTKKFFMQILCQWLVSPPIYMLRANRPQKQFSHLQFCEGWEKWKQTHKCCSYQLLFKYWIPWTDVNGRTSFCLPVEKKNIPYNRSQLLSRLYHLKSAYIYIICCNYDSCLTQNNLQKGLNPKRKRNILLIFCWNCLKIENHIGLLLQNAQHKMYFAYIYIHS